ncbi:glutamine amidotransferase-like class 1 domain-containing protein 1 isoform X3 [Manis javanica]|uniref:glutamine amidotransferase-like class 1 domain-containing protein 1 isoform X3 n=1 Tax=Manis javanica TaxID=9974 RepID=UPI0008130C08
MASERPSSRPACLLVASGAAEGVSAQSFLHCFSLASAAFNLQVATPGGKTLDFVDVNESNARWVQDFRLKAYASPAKLESIDGARYHALLIPSCPGALADLASSGSLARILQHFCSESTLCVRACPGTWLCPPAPHRGGLCQGSRSQLQCQPARCCTCGAGPSPGHGPERQLDCPSCAEPAVSLRQPEVRQLPAEPTGQPVDATTLRL